VAQTKDLTPDERAAAGRALRHRVPRSSHRAWEPGPKRRDPVKLLISQDAARVPNLLPIRYGRMLDSPFSFFRGAAYPMAADLAHTPTTGLRAQLCGDAHLSNFGGFASPERDLVFDVNDFDETLPGPWEWDVKRLGASVAVLGRVRGWTSAQRRRSALAAVGAYRLAMRRFAGMRNLEVWYAHLDEAQFRKRWEGDGLTGPDRKAFERGLAKARHKDNLKAMARLTERTADGVRIVCDPPILVPVEELLPAAEVEPAYERMRAALREYRSTLQGNRQHLLDGFRLVHLAHKVVGVGSVGTRAWIALLVGRDEDDPLFLQVKEANPSVLEGYAGRSRFASQGRRVIQGQRMTQIASDIFLGWCRMEGVSGRQHHYYVRQLWDWKHTANVDVLPERLLSIYGEWCGQTLAHAHARTGDRIAIAAYLGGGSVFDEAIADFSEAYADQTMLDHGALVAAVEQGRVEAQTGI
jgi:uncharacterized protein (DUF2252 family)